MKTHPELLQSPLEDGVIFHTLSGALHVKFDGGDGLISMDFPADTETTDVQPTVSKSDLAKAIGVPQSDVIHIAGSTGLGYAVIEVRSQVDIAGLPVDPDALVHWPFPLLI